MQASSELRQVFKDGIQRVGTEGAKVLRLLGEKVEKMEKLNPGDPLEEIHDAAENLQLMIDQKSYLLVNAESWESYKRADNLADPDKVRELKDNNEHKPFLIKSLSSINQQSTPQLQPYNKSTINQSRSEWGSGEDVFKHQTMWPSRLSLIGDALLNEREVRTYESASALSLATFTSLLIEFVARLQNLVDSYVELSEKAKFREHVESTDVQAKVGFWSKLLKWICCKD